MKQARMFRKKRLWHKLALVLAFNFLFNYVYHLYYGYNGTSYRAQHDPNERNGHSFLGKLSVVHFRYDSITQVYN